MDDGYIYLDHAATTYMFPEVKEAMESVSGPTNPSSLNRYGKDARRLIENARLQVAEFLNADSDDIIFTSGCTEANNIVLNSLGQGYDLICSSVEHHSVLENVRFNNDCLEEGDFFLKVEKDGSVSPATLEKMLRENTRPYSFHAASIMMVNNELGTINDIKTLTEIADDFWCPVHTDATQAVGHIPVDVKDLGMDYLTFSGHKIGGPMGVGVIYERTHKYLKDFKSIFGGEQEHGVRPGTENVPAIVGLGVACEIAGRKLESMQSKNRMLREKFLATLRKELSVAFKINGSSSNNSMNIVSLTIPGYNAEALAFALDVNGLAVSTGSACSSGQKSHVLKAIGLSEEDVAGTLRISFGWNTREDEVIEAAKRIANAVKTLDSITAGEV